MTNIEWKESFSVKVDAIDAQHKMLIRIFNDLGNAMVEKKGKEQVVDTLDRLVKYTEYHFSAEEELMLQCGYDDYEAHKKMHDELKEKVMALNERRNDEGFVLRLEIIYFLKNWLQQHILEIDKKAGAFISSKMSDPAR